MMEHILIKHARWALPFVFVITGFIAYAFWIGMPIQAPTNDAEKGVLGDSFGILTSLFSGLGFAGVVLTILIQQGQIKIQQEQIASQEQERVDEVNERRSLFNLDAALKATEQAKVLLQDGNNDRETWIEAGRLLGHAKVIGDGVTVDYHQRVLEASRLQYRRFFSKLINNKSAAFFFGMEEKMKTWDAAVASTKPAINKKTKLESNIHYLDEASIYRVWEAAQWPDDFDDSVGQRFSEEERKKLMVFGAGLREYLDYHAKYKMYNGELSDRKYLKN